MKTINFDSLRGALASRLYPQAYTNVPNSSLPVAIKNDVNVILKAAGRALPVDGFTLCVKANNGVLEYLNTPIVYGDAKDGVVIKWGNDLIPASDFKGENVELSVIADGTFNFLSIIVTDNEEDYLINFPIRFPAEAKVESAPVLNRLLKQGKLAATLAPVPVYELSTLITDLPEQSQHQVVGYTSREGSFGAMYTLTTDKGVRILANRTVGDILSASPIVSPEAPATLLVLDIYTTKQNKRRANATLVLAPGAYQDTDALNLDF